MLIWDDILILLFFSRVVVVILLYFLELLIFTCKMGLIIINFKGLL